MVKSSPEPVYVFQDFKAGAASLSFENIHGKKFLIVGTVDGVCKIFDLETMKSILELKCDCHAVGNTILRCGKWSAGTWAHVRMIGVQFWSVNNDFTSLHHFSIESNFAGFCGSAVFTASLSIDDVQEVVAVPCDAHVELYSLKASSYELLRTVKFESNSGMPMCLQINSDDQQVPSEHRMLIGFENGDIHAWNLNKNLHISKFKLHDEAVICMDFLTGGISGSVDEKIKFFNFEPEHQNLIEYKPFLTIPHKGVASISIRNDRKIFAIGSWDGKIRIFSFKNSKQLAILNIHSDSIQYVAFDGTIPKNNKHKYLAAASKDGTVSLWSLYEDV